MRVFCFFSWWEAVCIQHSPTRPQTHFVSGTQRRDLWLFEHVKNVPLFVNVCARVYHVVSDESRARYVMVMENLSQVPTLHLNSAKTLSPWSEADFSVAVNGLASFHSVFFGRCPAGLPQGWERVLEDRSARFFFGDHWEHADVWREEMVIALEKQQTLFLNHDDADEVRALLDASLARPQDLEQLDASSCTTLIHGDLSNRNCCLRILDNNEKRLCCFDFELAMIAHPLQDFLDLYCSGKRV